MKARKLGLDAVRAVAISLVLASHFLTRYTGVGAYVCYTLGTVGVEIFFVLSGYLIGGILLKAMHDNGNAITPSLVADFWFRRWMRTVPNYLLFLCVSVPLSESPSVRQTVAYLTFTQNLAWPMPSLLHVSWSLTIEEWFYLTLPTLMLFFWQFGHRPRNAFLAAMATLLIVPVALRLTLAPGRLWDEQVRKVVIFRLDSIIWGVLIAAVERYRPEIFRKLCHPIMVLAGASLVAAAALYLSSRFRAGGDDFTAARADVWIFTVMNVGCAIAVPMCSVLSRLPPGLTQITLRVSLWSYSLYLSHTGIMKIVGRTPLPSWSQPPAALLGTFIVSAFVYYYFEVPILKLRDRLSAKVTGAQRGTGSS